MTRGADPSGNPFLDAERVRGDLYRSRGRLTRRSGALLSAKIAGRPVSEVIATLANRHLPGHPRSVADRPLRILDVGCGRGSSCVALAAAFPQAQLVALDLSYDLVATAGARLAAGGGHRTAVQADFHRLPVASSFVDLVVAAFCLYHSPHPRVVLAEFARCLTEDGVAILVTKAEDSYSELDRLVTEAGLDHGARQRPSLYQSAHSDNLPALARGLLETRQVLHEQHTFRFADFAHVAAYLATTPKYVLPADLEARPAAITQALLGRLPERPITTHSRVTYIAAVSRGQAERGTGSACHGSD